MVSVVGEATLLLASPTDALLVMVVTVYGPAASSTACASSG